MRRFLTLVCLLCLAIPAGISISGCTRNPGENYCNGLGYGPKVTDVATLTLTPQAMGLTLAWGQTNAMTAPTAATCKNTTAAIGKVTWGTTNNQLLDVSNSGTLCAGTWNRNSGGGIPDYTICTAPTNPPASATAYVTAASGSVTSNPVTVHLHPVLTSLSLIGPTQCLSQGTTWSQALDVKAYYNDNGTQTLLCAPSSSTVPTCSSVLGSIGYTVTTSTIASVNDETGKITANMPGTSAIQAIISSTGATAGFFSTCPPAAINLALSSGATTGTLAKGASQTLVTSVTDTQGSPITGLTLDYQSTDPMDLSVTSTGAVTSSYPGVASITAICQPSSCNPSPINTFGEYGTGLPVASNAVTITTPGTASQYVWYMAPGLSQYVVPVEMLTGTVGSAQLLPYTPNSAVMDRTGTNIYFGTAHELIQFNTYSNTIGSQITATPGVVLAVSPNNSEVLVNDQERKLFYIYTVSGSSIISYGGLGTSAAWTPDSKTLYITDSAAAGTGHTNTLYVYNTSSGWTLHDLSATTGGSQNLAITVPSVGAYLSGSAGFSTVAHTWCPAGTAGNYASLNFYPQGDTISGLQTDTLAATFDGKHILGSALTTSGVTFSDISTTIPTEACPGVATSTTLTPLSTGGTLLGTLAVSGVQAASVNQVIASPDSSLAFLTYTPSTSTAITSLPYYAPAASGVGTLGSVTLTGSAITAPLAGAFTPDGKLFIVSTAGDNMAHYIDLSTMKDKQQISPSLPACKTVANGGSDDGCTNTGTSAVTPATIVLVKPRATT